MHVSSMDGLDREQLGTWSTRVPDGEFGVLVCLVAVPCIWAMLVAPMLGLELEEVVIAVGSAIGGGAVAGFVREFLLLHRQT